MGTSLAAFGLVGVKDEKFSRQLISQRGAEEGSANIHESKINK